MQALEAIKNRRSVRLFNSAPLDAGIIEELIDCARLATSARNIQPWEFVAVTTRPVLEKLGALIENARFIAQCACCIVIFCKETKYYLEDGCAATQNLLIAATSLGLSSCWVAGDKKEYAPRLNELLSVPEGFKLVSLVALGYSKAKVPAIPKRTLKEVLHWEKF
ncbi:MAG: nitroreductase family protein [Candidatus Omnitrophica bacterium]|nr:nitroreductase family protein [Candidatus Omnitrophota bacterium]